MEGFIHNLNTMHSRGGNQVVFSSINYGTDTSAEGRMVIEELLKATIEGLGTREKYLYSHSDIQDKGWCVLFGSRLQTGNGRL